jgi:2-phosphosulfolactate phosphatase
VCAGVIDVALTRAELRASEIAVVIDVLRATSVATEALAAGYERVLCAPSIEWAHTLRGDGRVLAGERHCLKPAGFDQGNSPREARHRRGRELVLATTNGAPAILEAAALAGEVLLGCLFNFEALLAELARRDPGRRELQLVCSGTDGAVALEDVYVAGRLSARLPGAKTDAALAAEAVARGFATAVQALGAGADARVLRAAGLDDDIADCASESRLDLVPRVSSTEAGVAVVVGDWSAGSDPAPPAILHPGPTAAPDALA